MQLSGPAARLSEALVRHCPGADPLGVAVSGGGDSMALLLACAERGRAGGPVPVAVTVDHGLRPEAAEEARLVAGTCARLGIPHATLRWTGWDGRGNLPDAARRARYGLIADWAKGQGIGRVALGHTLDDQAETVLMRLARGSGVDGLSAMTDARRDRGLLWLRPFLGIARADLRAFLTGRGVRWIDDPSNEDARYERVQARDALAALAPLGISAAGLAATAGRLSTARVALAHCTAEAAARVATEDRGDVLLDRAGIDALPDEIARRLLVAALCWVASADYPPRAEALAETLSTLTTVSRVTLHGCLIGREGSHLRIAREYAAVAGTRSAADAPWDRRWTLTGPATGDEEVRALGESGLSAFPGWRRSGLPRASLLASPAVWQGGTLIAAPLAGLANGWRAALVSPLAERILAH